MRLILLVLLLLASPALAGQGMIPCPMPYQSSGGTCTDPDDYVGYAVTPGSTNNASSNRMYLQLATPTCSGGCSAGTFGVPKVYHGQASPQRVTVCVYLDDGDETPDSGDTQVECSLIDTNTTEIGWVTLPSFTASASCSSKYFVAFSSPTGWATGYDATAGTAYYFDYTYGSEPATLGTATAISGRSYGIFVGIGQ